MVALHQNPSPPAFGLLHIKNVRVRVLKRGRILQVDPSHSRPIHCPIVHRHWHGPHLWRDYNAVKADVSALKHLKAVRMELGHLTDEEQRLCLMELLLEKAVALESMSVVT